MRVFLLQLLLFPALRAAYYEGLREFYSRVDEYATLHMLSDNSGRNSEGHCVTVVQNSGIESGVYIDRFACDSSKRE